MSAGGSADLDALSRQTSETGPLGAMSYQYDLAGRRTRMTWPDGVYVTYDWFLDNQMQRIRLSGTSTLATYAYDDHGRRTGVTRGNGAASTYGFDDVSRLTSLVNNVSGSSNDVA